MTGDSDDDTTYIYVPATSSRKPVAETTTRGRNHAAKPLLVPSEQAAIIRQGKDTSSSSASSPAPEAPAVLRPDIKMSKHAKHKLSAIPPLPPGYEEYADQIFSPPMVTVHICRICLRPRSDRYHREHPIAPGKIPPPASICRRCRVTTPDHKPKQAKLVRVTESSPVKIGLSGILPHATISRQGMEEEKRKNAKTAEAFHRNFVPVSKTPGRCSKLILYRHVNPEEVLGKARDLRSSNSSDNETSQACKPSKSTSKKPKAKASRDATSQQAAPDVETQLVVHTEKDSPPAVSYTESAIRRIAREEVEHYRQAERRIEAHPEPYARGRLVPAEAYERKIEISAPANDRKASKEPVKGKAASLDDIQSRQPKVEVASRTSPKASPRLRNASTDKVDKAGKAKITTTSWWPKDVPPPPVVVKAPPSRQREQSRYPYKDDAAAQNSKSAKQSSDSRKSETGEARKARLEAVYEPTPEQSREQTRSKNGRDAKTEAWSKETNYSREPSSNDYQRSRRDDVTSGRSSKPDLVVEHVVLPGYRESMSAQGNKYNAQQQAQSRGRSSEARDDASDWTDRDYWENDNTVRTASRRTQGYIRSQAQTHQSKRELEAARGDKQSMLATVSEETDPARSDRISSRVQKVPSNTHKAGVNQNLSRDNKPEANISWEYRLRTVEPVNDEAEQVHPAATPRSRFHPRDETVYHTDQVVITHRKPALDSDFRSSSVRFAPVVHITPTPPNSDDYPQSNDRFVEQRSQRRAQRRQDSFGHEPPHAAADVERRSGPQQRSTDRDEPSSSRHRVPFQGARSESPHREWQAAGLEPDPLTVGTHRNEESQHDGSSRRPVKHRGAIRDREHAADPVANFDRYGPYREEVPTASMEAITGSSRSSRMPDSSFRSR